MLVKSLVRRDSPFADPNEVFEKRECRNTSSKIGHFSWKNKWIFGTPHWGLNLDPDKYAGDEREQLFFSAGNYATDCSLLNL